MFTTNYLNPYNLYWSTAIHSHGVGDYMLHKLTFDQLWLTLPSSLRSLMYIYLMLYNLFGPRPFTPMELATTCFTAYFDQLWLTLPRVRVLCTFLSNALQLIWSTTFTPSEWQDYMLHSLFWSTIVDFPQVSTLMYNSIYNLCGQRPFTPMELAVHASVIDQLWWLSQSRSLCTILSTLIWSTTIHSHGVAFCITAYLINYSWFP